MLLLEMKSPSLNLSLLTITLSSCHLLHKHGCGNTFPFQSCLQLAFWALTDFAHAWSSLAKPYILISQAAVQYYDLPCHICALPGDKLHCFLLVNENKAFRSTEVSQHFPNRCYFSKRSARTTETLQAMTQLQDHLHITRGTGPRDNRAASSKSSLGLGNLQLSAPSHCLMIVICCCYDYFVGGQFGCCYLFSLCSWSIYCPCKDKEEMFPSMLKNNGPTLKHVLGFQHTASNMCQGKMPLLSSFIWNRVNDSDPDSKHSTMQTTSARQWKSTLKKQTFS